MDTTTLLSHALAYGGALSVAMSALIVVSIRLCPEAWVGDYPKDIQERYGPMSARGRRIKWVFGIPLLLAPLVFAAALLARLHAAAEATGAGISFSQAAVAVLVMGMVFNLVDLVMIDWLLFVYVQPAFVVLPGTEGMAGYKDYGFHFRAFLIGTAFCTVVSLVAAGLYRVWAPV